MSGSPPFSLIKSSSLKEYIILFSILYLVSIVIPSSSSLNNNFNSVSIIFGLEKDIAIVNICVLLLFIIKEESPPT